MESQKQPANLTSRELKELTAGALLLLLLVSPVTMLCAQILTAESLSLKRGRGVEMRERESERERET